MDRRKQVIASLVAAAGLMLLVGVIVFVETLRTLQGHRDGPALSVPLLISGLAGVTGVAIGVLWRRRRHRH